MADYALETCRWFPTIAECLEIIGRWQRNDEPLANRKTADAAVRREMNARFDETFAALKAQTLSADEIAALSAYWRDIAVERGLIRTDGSYRNAA